MSNSSLKPVTEEFIPVDSILKWREYQFALKNGGVSNATESPEVGPLSHEPSLKAAVKYVLKTMGCPMYPPLIRYMLQRMGFPVAKYRGNVLLSIHPTLYRMVAKGQVRKTRDKGRNSLWSTYEWIEPD